jgi:hypothetical protein
MDCLLTAQGTVKGNAKTVSLVTQALEQLKSRLVVIQNYWLILVG